MYVVCLGFFDKNKPLLDILNTFYIKTVFESKYSFKVILALYSNIIINERVNGLISRIKLLVKLFNNKIKKLGHYLNIFMTKAHLDL